MVKVPRLRRRKRPITPGSRPGQLVVDSQAVRSRLSAIAWNEQEVVERPDCTLDDLPELLEQHPVTWVDVVGLGDQQILEGLGQMFDIHPLALEDVVNVPQRPKIELHGEQVFIAVQLLTRSGHLEREQVSLCLGEGFVVTFQERRGDPFEPVRQRIRQERTRLRQSGPDYLAYALLDAVIDHYFPVLEELQDHLEELESILREPQKDGIERIQRARGELVEARQGVGPLRDVVRSLVSGDDWPILGETTRIYLRDCRDHVLEAYEQLETCREIASSLMDVHLSTVSHQANQTMKMLTVIATIFMPLSFLAGIYGMNFDTSISPWNLPELSSPIGYPILLGVMTGIALGLVILFWRKGWFD